MTRPLADSPHWTPSLTGPTAGDPRTADSVNAPLEGLAARSQALRHRDHLRPLVVEPGVTAVEVIGRTHTGGTSDPVHVIAVREAMTAPTTLVIDLRLQGSRLVEGDEIRVVRTGARASNTSRIVDVRLWREDGAQDVTVRIAAHEVGVVFSVMLIGTTLTWAPHRKLVRDPAALPAIDVGELRAGGVDTETAIVRDSLTAAQATIETAAIGGGTAQLASAEVAALTATTAIVAQSLDVRGDGMKATVAAIDTLTATSVMTRALAMRAVVIDANPDRRRAFCEASDWVPGYFQSPYPGVEQTPQDPFWFARMTGEPIPDVVRAYNPSLPATVDDLIPQADREISQLQWFDYRYGIGRANRRLEDAMNPLDPVGTWVADNPAFTLTCSPDMAAVWVIRPWAEGRPQALLAPVAPEGATLRIVFARAEDDVSTAPTSLFVGVRSLMAPWRMVDPGAGYVERALTELPLKGWADFMRIGGAWVLTAKGSL